VFGIYLSCPLIWIGVFIWFLHHLVLSLCLTVLELFWPTGIYINHNIITTCLILSRPPSCYQNSSGVCPVVSSTKTIAADHFTVMRCSLYESDFVGPAHPIDAQLDWDAFGGQGITLNSLSCSHSWAGALSYYVKATAIRDHMVHHCNEEVYVVCNYSLGR